MPLWDTSDMLTYHAVVVRIGALRFSIMIFLAMGSRCIVVYEGLRMCFGKKLDKTHFHPTVFKHCGKGYHTPSWAWKRVSASAGGGEPKNHPLSRSQKFNHPLV